MTKTLQKILDTVIGEADVDIHRVACEPGGDISEGLDRGPLIDERAADSLVIFHELRKVEEALDGHGFLPVGDVPMTEIQEKTALRVTEVMVVEDRGGLFAEIELKIVLDKTEHILKQAFAVDNIVLVVRDGETEAGEEFVRAEAGAFHRDEVRILLDRLEGFPCDVITVSAPEAASDDTQLFELAKDVPEADELDVGTTDITGEVVIVTSVRAALFQDGGQQDRRPGADAEAVAYGLDFILQFVLGVLAESFLVDLLVDDVQAGGQFGDCRTPHEAVLVVVLYSSHTPWFFNEYDYKYVLPLQIFQSSGTSFLTMAVIGGQIGGKDRDRMSQSDVQQKRLPQQMR